jgi:hypothetical protein
MPLFLAALIGALVSAAGSLVGRVLISLGIGYVAYHGVDTSIAWAKASALAGIQGLPAQAVAAASAMKVGKCISILMSALVARMTISGLTSGTLKRMVVK